MSIYCFDNARPGLSIVLESLFSYYIFVKAYFHGTKKRKNCERNNKSIAVIGFAGF